MGLEIEHKQRKLRHEVTKPQNTQSDLSISKRRATLGRQIISWSAYQEIFMPAVAESRSQQLSSTNTSTQSAGAETLHGDEENAAEHEDSEPEDPAEYPYGVKAEDFELFLPSPPVSG